MFSCFASLMCSLMMKKREKLRKVVLPRSDDFAEAMKAIEKVRKEDIKTEILRIDKKIAQADCTRIFEILLVMLLNAWMMMQ